VENLKTSLNDINIIQQSSDHKIQIEQTIKKAQEKINIKGFKHVFESQCFKNSFDETMVDFFELTDSIVAKKANIVVDSYYHHTLENPSY